MPNSLHNQPSPYLKELSKQPVNWQPWGQRALDLAARENKPVIVSIGYASCHWCRQMSRENYEDSYIASIMNRHFICIKVDREERPDLDLFYMEASRMFNQSAGWPLHAFCLPDGSPFWCGTFFPKEDTGQGIAPWPQVLMRIAEHFRTARDELEENSKNALANLSHSNQIYLSDFREWQSEILIEAGKILCEAHDDQFGGFTPAPKFPSSMKMDFLFALNQSATVREDQKFSEQLDSCLTKTLDSLATKGLFDHINGGFFRYCLDNDWQSPHFEKILSDNTLLVSTFSRGLKKFNKDQYRDVITSTLAWIEDEMGRADQGYAGSTSAEIDGMEGAYYLWSKSEIIEAVGQRYGQKLITTWKPFTKSPTELFLPRLLKPDILDPRLQKELFVKLQNQRTKLAKPQRDEKRSCAQHALLVRAYIDAALALGNKDLVDKAYHLLMWMDTAFEKSEESISSFLYPDLSKSKNGFLEDYTYWAEAILSFASLSEIYGLGLKDFWIKKAESLVDQVVKQFKDSAFCGYFISPVDLVDPTAIRKKSWFDHALPSGNSSLLRCFHTLAQMGGNKGRWNTEYQEALGGYCKLAKTSPDGIGHALSAITEASVGIIEIFGPKEKLNRIFNHMVGQPHRPVFYSIEKEFTLQVNQKVIDKKFNNPKEIFKILSE